MTRSIEHATLICAICTLLALAGVAGGWYWHKGLVTVIAMFPAVIYEVYRTEGVSTIWASWGMLAVMIAEAALIISGFNFNIARYITSLPALDIKLAGPVLMAYFSYVLIRRTAGKYTKWLAAVILVGCLGLFYILDPSLFGRFADTGIREGLQHIPAK